ncbi:MAG: CRTAC1 family protein [Acidobacteriota bacterium]
MKKKAEASPRFGLAATALAALVLSCWGLAGRPRTSSEPVFREVAESAGLKFQHFTGGTGKYYLPEIMGPGAALFDYDGDGDLDAYVLQGSFLDSTRSPARDSPAAAAREPLTNRLFRNEPIGRDGSSFGPGLHFTDVTGKAGVGDRGYGMGVAVGDADNDGDLDLYITNFGGNVFYRNNGNGTFTDITAASGTGDDRWSTSAAFFDYDRDGDLDLFVLNYIDFTVAGNKRCYDAVGAFDYCNPNLYRPLPDRLFQNEGRNKFIDVTERSGIGSTIGPGLGVGCGDFNRDGWIDLYVANDGAQNFLWINQGDGTFEESALMAGAAFNAEGAPEGSMGLAVGDFDGDGDEDLFMTHLTMETNTLYLNDGSGNFHDTTIRFGLAGTSFAFTGFGTEWFDYDNDGRLDLFVANGAVRNLEDLRGDPYPYHQRNQLFHNDGGGKYSESSSPGGPAFQLSEVSRGAAFGDVDNDGDVDVLVTNNRGPVRLLLNQIGTRHHWVEIGLESSAGNRFGVGARVKLIRRGKRPLWRRVGSDGSYLSGSDLRVHFGLGSSKEIEAVVAYWPDGRKEKWNAIRPDTIVRLRKNTGKPLP